MIKVKPGRAESPGESSCTSFGAACVVLFFFYVQTGAAASFSALETARGSLAHLLIHGDDKRKERSSLFFVFPTFLVTPHWPTEVARRIAVVFLSTLNGIICNFNFRFSFSFQMLPVPPSRRPFSVFIYSGNLLFSMTYASSQIFNALSSLYSAEVALSASCDSKEKGDRHRFSSEQECGRGFQKNVC